MAEKNREVVFPRHIPGTDEYWRETTVPPNLIRSSDVFFDLHETQGEVGMVKDMSCLLLDLLSGMKFDDKIQVLQNRQVAGVG